MTHTPTLHSLVDETIAYVPTLSLAVMNETQELLKSRPQHHLLYAAWSKLRGRFAQDFENSLLPLLQAARRGVDPLQRSAPLSLDSLSLVDEHQALQDVAVAHVVTVVEDLSKSELHQLGNFFAALRGIARPLKNDNPLRAALFAQALNRAAQAVDLDAEGRYALVRVAAQPLAAGLQLLYRSLCQHLHEAQLAPLVAAHASAASASAAANLHMRQFSSLNAPNTLDRLAQRVDEFNSRPQRLSQPSAQILGPAVNSGSGADLLSRLYDQILADPRLPAPVRPMLARLQVAVARLARTDLSLLRRQDHPTWTLLNRVAAHSMAFERGDDERLSEFLNYVAEQVQRLVEAPLLGAHQFQQVLSDVEEFIRQQAARRSQRSATALAALEREQQRSHWQQLIREQIKAQLLDAAISPLLRDFLKNSWTEVIVQAMVLQGRDSAEAHAHIDLVDELLSSLQVPGSEAARVQLRSKLPGLIARLEQGIDSIALPATKRQQLLNDLMQQHGRVLRGQPAAAQPAPAPAPRRELSPEELLQQLLSDRESQAPSHWARNEVDRGQLPTVPVQLYSESSSPDARAAVEAWMDQLQLGQWYHLFVQSQWLTAQIAWISESRQFFLFVGQDADERHSLTRGALEQLLANGLITALDEQSLVERAVDTLMQNLDDKL
ncbi:DUF1631 family protein [Paucibacter sp. APW11]|uniref:DUF1631 family protein n=1 Tax=Roseateles aquae TaxID=3077235 RepID=A0ABU3PF90_9BURK|nr:DUF1631 family protein [Paucibacter sp. APW11]MDT9000586.1 DUF1631 family protein [Paucibacter sp. APW11]